MPLQKIGVQAVVEGMGQFKKDLRSMRTNIAGAGKATVSTTKTATEAGKALGGLGKDLGSMSAMATSSLGGLGGVVVGVATGNIPVLIGGLTSLGSSLMSAGKSVTDLIGNLIQFGTDTINSVVSSLQSLAMESLFVAGRTTELTNSAIAVGASFGWTAERTREAIKEFEAYGIRTDKAAAAVMQFTRNQLDLAKSQELVRIAQAAGIPTGEDSSEMLNALIFGITEQNTLVMKNRGIVFSATQAYKDYAAVVGKSVESFTATDRSAAFLNATLKSGESLLGVYDAAMKSPTKALRSMGRETHTLKAALGAPFQDAFFKVVTAGREIVKTLIAMTSEGGKLYPILVNLGAIASIAGDAILGFATRIKDALGTVTEIIKPAEQFHRAFEREMRVTGKEASQSFAQKWLGGLARVAEKTLRWGVQITVNLAEGMVEGASTAIIWAMDQINALLTWWLAPGSPPRLLPELDSWGSKAMTEYLHGMTQADFGVLEALQKPLKSILDFEAFREISVDIAGALAAGEVDESFFNRLKKAAGSFGKEVVNLAKLQFAHADAIERVAMAQEALKQAQKAITEGQGAVRDLTEEYNDLLRAGASREVLDAKLAELNVAEAGLETAVEQQSAAESAVETAEEQASAIQAQMQLQDKMLQQLIDLSRQQQETVASMAGLGAALGDALADMPPIDLPAKLDLEGEDFMSGLDLAIEEAKKLLNEKLADIFAPLQTSWDETIKPVLTELQTKWDDFWAGVATAGDTFWTTYGDDIEGIKTAIVDAFTAINDAGGEFKRLLFLIGLGLNTVSKRIVEKLLAALDEIFPGLQDWIDQLDIVDFVLGRITANLDFIKESADGWALAFQTLGNALAGIPAIADRITGGLGGVAGAVGEATNAINNFPGMGRSPSPFETSIRGVSAAIQELRSVQLPGLTTQLKLAGAAAAPAPIAAAPLMAPQTSQTLNANFDTSISGQMDGALFEARVMRVIEKAFAGA